MDALRTVAGLKKGRSDAKERAAVHAVSELQVFDVIAKASRIIGAMIDLQLITGMRSGELVIMHAIDIDRSGKVWAAQIPAAVSFGR